MLCALALSNLFFIITAIQYWASAYEKKVLGVADEDQIFLSFAIVCITSPTLGLFFGGVISAKTGGYEAKHSILVCFVFGLLAGIAAIPVPITNDIFYFTLYLWLVLFFGGAILPNLIGIIITSLPHHLRGSANSMTNLITNLFGYLPAPAVYGTIFEKYKETNDRLAMQVVIYSSFIGSFLLVFAMYFRYMQKAKEELTNFSQERKTSLISANSNLTNNLAKLYNPNSAININNYENTIDKDFEQEDEGSSSSSSNSDCDNNTGDKIQNKQQRENRSDNSGGKSRISNDSNNKSKSKSKNANNSNSSAALVSAKSHNDFADYLSANNNSKKNKDVIKNNNSDDKKKKQLQKTNSPSRKSFDVTLVEENSELYENSPQANMLVAKNYSQSAINNVSIDSRTNKKDRSASSNNNSENSVGGPTARASANPNFNYNKYLQENVFNVPAENEDSNNHNLNLNVEYESDKNSNANVNAENKNKRKMILKAEADSNLSNNGVLNSKNIYGKNYSYLSNSNSNTNNNNNNNNLNLSSAYLNPVSIKTPNFNFVGNNSNENSFLEEKERLGNFPNLSAVVNSNSNYNSIGDYLGHGSNFALNSDGSIVNKSEIFNKQNHNSKSAAANPNANYESSDDNKIKFSYESADNNRSEYSLFNPMKNNLAEINKNLESKNNSDELRNENKILNEQKIKFDNPNIQNASLFVGKSNAAENEKESSDKLASYEQEDILISEQSVDFDNSKYNAEASNSFKKFDDYI